MESPYAPLLSDEDKQRGNNDVEHSATCDCAQSCKHTSRKTQIRSTVLALLLGALLWPTASWFLKPLDKMYAIEALEESLTQSGAVEECESNAMVPVTAPKKNIWKNLSIKEATDIRAWLWKPERGFNLTKSAIAVEADNSVFLIEAYTPPKAKALAYLDDGSDAPKKYARAIIHHGNDERIVDYLIGPLPLSGATEIRPLTEIYHRPEIPYNAHGFGINSTAMGRLIASVFSPLGEVTEDLFGGSSRGYANDTIVMGGNAPLSYDGSWRRMWVQMKLNVPGHYLFPLDMYSYFDLSGTDHSQWKLLKMVYNNQVFASPEEFKSAWANGTLIRSEKPVVNDKSGWATRTREGKGMKRDLDERAGPRSVSFNGPRFRVDEEEQYVTWMGWKFYLGFERDMGMNLWDIQFRGERIIYEITPQEAMAQYSGSDPHQSMTVFLDSAFGMGTSVKELMVGYDCPGEAFYLPATVHTAAGSSVRHNAICIFERDTGKPLSRHTGWLKDEMGAIKGYELTVRSISTVGNYDYLFDYTFQLDGTVEIRVSASGYLQGGVWKDEQSSYGHRLRETAMGSLHDHVINYKIDFDIAGTKNSLQSLKLEIEEHSRNWFDEDWGKTVTQQKIVRKQILNENDSSTLEYAKNMEGQFIITNEDAHNKWGNARGYAVHPGASAIHLTNLDCKRTQDNVNWAKQHLAVSRRKDDEPKSSSMWNIHLPGAPTVDFYKIFDGESLDQEDLVVWLNLGTHHIPRAEDSPHTLTNVATSSVLLVPFNFNDYDVSMESMNSIVVNAPTPGGLWSVDENEVVPKFCLPKKQAPFSYTGLVSYEEDGSPAEVQTIMQQRKEAESWHGLMAEI